MSTTTRGTAAINAVSKLMRIMLVTALAAPLAFGGKTYAEPIVYEPPAEANPGYSGALSWVNYTPQRGFVPGPAQPMPFSLDIDDEGNVYTANISIFMPGQGNVETVPAGGGQPSAHLTRDAALTSPRGIAVDDSGNLYVSDNSEGSYSGTNVPRILKLPYDTDTWRPVTPPGMRYASGVAVDRDGNVYAIDSTSYNTSGNGSGGSFQPKIWKSGNGGTAWTNITGNTAFRAVFDIAADGEGNVFVVDNPMDSNQAADGSRIYRLPHDKLDEWEDVTPAAPIVSFGIGVDPSDHVFAADILTGQIMKLPYGGGPGDWETVQVLKRNPLDHVIMLDIAADSSGYLYGTSLGSSFGPNVITLRATVVYEGNGNTGGSVPVDTAGYKSDDAITVPGAGTLVKAGFHFTGWNTAADGSGQQYEPGAAIDMTQSITLYAAWSTTPPTPSYTVSYAAGTGGAMSGAASEQVPSGGSPAAVPAVTPDPGYDSSAGAATEEPRC